MNCPNTNSPEYKKAISEIGINDTYKLFMLTGGYNYNTDINDKPNIFLQKLKYKYKTNKLGLIESKNYDALISDISTYNIGDKRINIFEHPSGDYRIELAIPSIDTRNEDIVDKQPILVSELEVVDNPQPTSYSNHKLGFNVSFKESHSHVNFILGKIINRSSASQQHKFLAKFLKQIPNEYKNVGIALVNGLKDNKGFIGEYYTSSKVIALDNNLSENKLVTSFEHELLHHITYDTLENPKTEKQKQIISEITTLREKAKGYYENILGVELTENSINQNKNLRPYYGLIDNHEFISCLFTEPDFQKVLESGEFTVDKSLLERIAEIIKELLETIGNFKFSTKEDAFVIASIANCIKLVEDIVASPIGENIESSKESLGALDNGINLLPLKGNEFLYEKFNLLNKEGDVKEIPFTTLQQKQKANKWIDTLNKSPYHSFKIVKVSSHGKIVHKIFMYNREVIKASLTDNVNKSLINEFKEKLANRKDRLEEEFRKEKDIARKTELRKRVEIIKDQLTDLVNINTYSNIVTIANENLDYVKELLGKDKLSASDIIEIQNFTALYKDVVKYLQKDFKYTPDINKDGKLVNVKTAIYNQFEAIESRAKEIDTEIFDVECKYLIDYYEGLFNTKINKEDLFKIGKDISGIESNFRSAGSFGIKLLEIQEAINKLANNRANDYRNKLVKQNDSLFKEVEKNALFQSKGNNVFKEIDENGWTGNKISKFNKKYWSEFGKYFWGTEKEGGLTRLLLKNNKTGADKQKITNFFKWYNENHFTIDYSKLDDDTYKESIIKRFGQVHGTKLVNQAIEKSHLYELEKTRYSNYLEENELIPTERTRKIYNWEIYNSPMRFKQTVEGKPQLTSFGSYPNHYNYNFITSTPIEKHFNEDYNVLEQEENKVLLVYLEFTDDVMTKLRSLAPDNLFKDAGFGVNTLPIVGKDLIEKYAKDGMLNSMTSSLGDWFKEFVTHSSEKDNNQVDEYTGRKTHTLEIKGISKSPILEYDVNSGKLIENRDKQSDNISALINYAINNLALYQNKSDLEDAHRMVSRAMSRIGIDEFGHNANQNELKNIKSVSEFYDQVYYGKASSIGGELDRKLYNSNEKVKVKEIKSRVEDVLDLLGIELENSPLSRKGIEEIEAILPSIEEIINNIEDVEEKNNKIQLVKELNNLVEAESKLGSSVSAGKIGRSLLKYVQTKAMGWNIFSGINEILYGMITTFNFSTGEEIFNKSDWGKAFGIMLRFRDDSNGTKKVWKLLEKFNLIKNSMVENIEDSKLNRVLFWTQKKAEAFTRGITMVATLNAIKIKDINGEEISLFDAIDENGEINKAVVGEEEYNKWHNTEGVNEFEKVAIKIQAINSTLHGNYDPDTPIKAKQDLWAMAILQFRTWMLEGIAARGQNEHFDSRLGIVVKGRYRTMDNSDAWKALAKHLLFIKQDQDFEKMSDVDKANIRKNATELAFGIMLTLVLLVLTKLGDDDEDEENTFWNYSRNILINTGFRIQTDLLFYINPNEIENLSSKMIPATQLLTDIAEFSTAVTQTIMGEPNYKSGLYKDHSKLLKESAQFLPVTNQPYKWWFLANQTIDKIRHK